MRTEVQSCEEALRVLAAHLDGELEPSAQQGLEQHLETCRSCYSRAEFERRLKVRITQTGHAPVRSELQHRIQRLLREFTEADAD